MDRPLYELETDDSIPSINFFGNLDISDVAQIRIQERPEDKCAILTLIKDNGDVLRSMSTEFVTYRFMLETS